LFGLPQEKHRNFKSDYMFSNTELQSNPFLLGLMTYKQRRADPAGIFQRGLTSFFLSCEMGHKKRFPRIFSLAIPMFQIVLIGKIP
jgi:hypothetical protein